MGSIANYPYQALLNSMEVYCFKSVPSASDPLLAGNKVIADTNIGYIPDARASGLFFSYANQDLGGDIGYKTESDSGTFTVTLYNPSDNTVIAVTSLNNANLLDDNGDPCLSFSKYNFWILPDYTTDPITIKRCGIAVQYSGIYNGQSYVNTDFNEFTDIDGNAVTALNSLIEIRQTSNFYGVVTEELKNSNDFKVTVLPDEIFEAGREPLNQSLEGYWDKSVLIVDDIYSDYDHNGRYRYIVDAITTYTWGSGLQSQGAVLAKFFAKYNNNNSIGSDLLRLTADGKYTNGADLSATDLSNGLVNDRRINFEGGYFKVRRQFLGGSTWYFDLYNSNDVLIDTWHCNGTSDPITGTYGGGISNAVYNGYLCKYNNSWYIVSLIQGGRIKDNDGNRIVNNNYNMADVVSIVYKFNNNANQLLNEGSEQKIEYNLADIDEDSPEASTGENSTEGYDRRSTWSGGAEAGTSDGIRHNGSNNIDASNLEQTRASVYNGISTPVESGTGSIPTPLNTGMLKAFAPSPEELEKFGIDLNSATFATAIRNYFNNPMDIIVSCHTCVAPTLNAGAECYLTYGTWSSQNAATPYSMHVLEQMYYSVAYGELNLSEITNDWRFYEKQELAIYLPWIGVRDVDPKLLNGKALKLYYHINVLTGDILAELKALNEDTQHLDTYYVWSGNTLSQMPFKSTDYSAMVSGLLSTVLSTGTAIAGAASGNPLALLGGVQGLRNIKTHPDIKLIGTVTGSSSYFMSKTPMLIRRYPYALNKQPLNYARLHGQPSNIGSTIRQAYSATGNTYIKYKDIDLNEIYTANGSQATEAEKNELETLLKTGVYI